MKKISLLYLLMLLFFASGCSFMGKTADRNDWYGLMGPGTYVEYHRGLIENDQAQALANTEINIQRQVARAIASGNVDEINKWVSIREKVYGAGNSSTISNKGLVFSSNRRKILKIFSINDRRDPVVQVAFDRNRKQYVDLPYGSYIPVWYETGDKRPKRGDMFRVKPGKKVFFDGNQIGWYAAWR